MAGRPRRCRRMLLLVAVGTLAALPAVAGGRERPAAARPALFVEVQPGDTVWTIARSYGDPTDDVREHVWRIQKANRLEVGRIEPGTVVMVPPECLPHT